MAETSKRMSPAEKQGTGQIETTMTGSRIKTRELAPGIATHPLHPKWKDLVLEGTGIESDGPLPDSTEPLA